jgi:predicted MFS family arabinose efflux permease
VATSPSAWTPLRNGVFRALWLAVLASNAGTWMQTVGAQWLVVQEPHAATWTSLVQTVTVFPVLLLALPAGTLADSLDRRRLLLTVQVASFAVGAVLTVLTARHEMPPALLLVFTFLLGVGQAVTIPTWQAVIPEVVPRAELPAASALGAVNTNLARSAGPAVAGLLVAQLGSAAVFGLNALSFAIFAVVLVAWRRPPQCGGEPPEHFTEAVRAGERFVRYSPSVRRILLWVLLFVIPGSVVWGLLPLVARQHLHLGAQGYGILLAALGVGAIAGALLMPRIRNRSSPDQLIVASCVVYGAALAVIALVPRPVVAIVALVFAGLAWMALVSRMNASMQLFLPNWVRARGFAIYQVVFAGAQAAGAFLWGQVTTLTSLRTAYLAAAVLLAAGAVAVRWLPLHPNESVDNDPVNGWAEPNLMLDPRPEDGPVLVTSAYRVAEANVAAFREAMEPLRRARLATGATRWGLFRDGADPERFLEVFQVPTWEEHLRQHDDRMTAADRSDDERAASLAEGPPAVSHLLPSDAPPVSMPDSPD